VRVSKVFTTGSNEKNTFESGKYQPSLELAFKLAKVFGKRVDEIFVLVDGEGE
jgi:DNA-binding XRE family transcriptional regulator